MDKTKIELLVEKRKTSRGWGRWLKGKAQRDLLQELVDEVPIPKTLSEKIVWLRDGLTDYPKCPICGSSIMSFDVEYLKFCSCKCAQASQQTRDKYKKTCIEKYGVDNSTKSDTIQKKMKDTCLERYGATNVFASSYGKEKIRETNLSRYGVENPQQDKKIREKTEKTLVSRYGKVCVASGVITRSSKGEVELYNFIKNICPSAKHADRNLIAPMELDIFIEELHIAFEYDGDYWHSLPDMVERDFRKDKVCKEKNIRLIRIKESDWKKDKEKVCSMIMEVLKNG